jgi:hypothetical protein
MPGTGAPSRYATGMPEGFSLDSVFIDAKADASVHPLVRKAAAWSWRLLIILGALIAFFWVVMHLEVIVVPILLATMVAAMLLPLVDNLDRRGCTLDELADNEGEDPAHYDDTAEQDARHGRTPG